MLVITVLCTRMFDRGYNDCLNGHRYLSKTTADWHEFDVVEYNHGWMRAQMFLKYYGS